MSERSPGRKDPLSRLGDMPKIPPHDPCTRCFKGDINRGFVVYGDGEWTAAMIVRFVEIEADVAVEMAKLMRKETDTPFDERHLAVIRLCRGCARLTDAPVMAMDNIKSGAAVTALIQPEDES